MRNTIDNGYKPLKDNMALTISCNNSRYGQSFQTPIMVVTYNACECASAGKCVTGNPVEGMIDVSVSD